MYLNNPYYSKSVFRSLLKVFGFSEPQIYTGSWSCGEYGASRISSEHPLRPHFLSEELRALWKLVKNVLPLSLTLSLYLFSLSILHTYTHRHRHCSYLISYILLYSFPKKSDLFQKHVYISPFFPPSHVVFQLISYI